MKILVVEDSSAMRSYLAALLEDEGEVLEVVEAENGFAALKALPHHTFDAILTDINMPDINGLELVSFLKSHPLYQTIPIMVISTEGSEQDLARAALLGAEEYLIKPFTVEELRASTRRLLRVSRDHG